jgi:hypothetical protein
MGSIVMREKDDVQRRWLVFLEFVEWEGGSVQEKYEKIQKYVRRAKALSGPYDSELLEFVACARRQKELASRMLVVAQRGDVSVEVENLLAVLSNECNRIVMYSRRVREGK